jgi:hypothetical protein
LLMECVFDELQFELRSHCHKGISENCLCPATAFSMVHHCASNLNRSKTEQTWIVARPNNFGRTTPQGEGNRAIAATR